MPDGMVAVRGLASSTPNRLRGSAVIILLLALLTGAISIWAASRIGDAAQTIGRDAEPSVTFALRMAATLSDMDSSVLEDVLLDNGAAMGTSVRYTDAIRQLSSDLVQAAQNITYGEAEAGPLRSLQESLIAYEQAVVEARYIGAGDAWITSRRVQWASRVNRDRAVPQALALSAANAGQLEQRYAGYRATSLVFAGAGVLSFAVLLLALLAVQVWLARTVRRVINPLLAAATLVAGLGGIWFGTTVLTERADLRAAKNDAYDSLKVLYQAKGEANALQAATSLWLLDPTARPEAQGSIDAARLALLATDLTNPSQLLPLRTGLQTAQRLEQQGKPAEALAAAPHLAGLLGDEMANVTFGAPERDAATDSIARLANAEALVRSVQAQEQAGRRAFVVARWLNEGARAFAALQAAIDRTIAINQSEFDRRVASALGTAHQMPWVISAALALSTLLAAGGLWLRLREYR